MDYLWAPWRMGYIVDIVKEHDGCFLCDALKRKDDRRSYILYRSRHSCVIMNRYPYNSGHLLVIPCSHVPDMNSLSPDELTDLMRCAQASIDVLKQGMEPEAFNVGINLGKAAGAGLPDHMHMQIVPRWTGDTSSITVFDRVRVVPELLDETYERLKPHFEHLSGR